MILRYIFSGTMLCIVGLSLIISWHRPEVRYHDQVAVLMYHHIHDEDKSTSTISSSLFHGQLSYLKNKGYHFISLTEFKAFLSGASVPENAVLVTFDDGYESFYTNAFPILSEENIPAVNFIITKTLDHPLDDMPPKLSREQIQKITAPAKGIDVQCHTHAFHDKNESGQALLLKDSRETDAEYQQRLTVDTQACMSNLLPLQHSEPIDSLAYPYGIYNKQTAEAIRAAGIQYAFTIAPRMATRTIDPLKIPRINAGNPYITPEGLNMIIKRRVVVVPTYNEKLNK